MTPKDAANIRRESPTSIHDQISDNLSYNIPSNMSDLNPSRHSVFTVDNFISTSPMPRVPKCAAPPSYNSVANDY